MEDLGVLSCEAMPLLSCDEEAIAACVVFSLIIFLLFILFKRSEKKEKKIVK